MKWFWVAVLAGLAVPAMAQQSVDQPGAETQSVQPEPQKPGPPAQHSLPPNAKVYIIWPSNGMVIHGGFWLRMGLSNAGVAPAGVDKPGTGHHHVIVDADLPPLDEEIPNDKNHLHFGLGQTEARLELPPGPHTLQLLFADAGHVPHNPPLYSQKITIYVQ